MSQVSQSYNGKSHNRCGKVVLLQTSFSHISINSLTILTVSMATESPWKDLLIDTSHISKWSVLAEILGRSTSNYCKGDRREDSRRFLRELDEAPGGNNLHYILQCLCVLASVARVWTKKVCWVATECSWNDGSKTQYYVVILDRLQGRSRALEQAPESRIRGPLTTTIVLVTNFIWPYLHQFFNNSYGLNSYGKPLKRPFDRY